MATEKRSSKLSAGHIYECEIPIKFISLNEYVNKCRRNKYEAANYKRQVESDVRYFINRLPKLRRVSIHFHWIEKTRRRDPDNIAFGKKFILDALVTSGKLENDNQDYVVGFRDTFEHGKENKVVLFITEE